MPHERQSPERAKHTALPKTVLPFQGNNSSNYIETQGVALGYIVCCNLRCSKCQLQTCARTRTRELLLQDQIKRRPRRAVAEGDAARGEGDAVGVLGVGLGLAR